MHKIEFKCLLFFLSTLLFAQFGTAQQLMISEKLHPQKGCIDVPENYSLAEGSKISICYQWLNTYDSNKKTYIFLVGGPGAAFDYYLKFQDFWLSTKLGQKFNILFFNPRGVGSSSEININNLSEHDLLQYNLTNMTNDVESLRKKLLGNQAIGVIGHSTGGHQVFDYAIRFPDHVFKVISLHGGVTSLGFLTQAYYRFNEWGKAIDGINTAKLTQLQNLIQSGAACDQDGSGLPKTMWSQIVSLALYGTSSQRQLLSGLLNSLIQGNIDSQNYCTGAKSSTKKLIPEIPSNDPLNAMSGVNLIINLNVICSNFITKDAVSSLSVPYHDPTFNFVWSPQCLPLLKEREIVESQFDVSQLISNIKVPIFVVGADSDQWMPFIVQKEIWQNLSTSQVDLGKIVELKQCGHFSFYECPDQLKAALDGFIE